jgi:hypothetical protein
MTVLRRVKNFNTHANILSTVNLLIMQVAIIRN